MQSTDTNIFVILIEDFSALTGLTIVLISSLLSLINPIFDADRHPVGRVLC